ncbi:MAG TPA: deoxyribodipyrimidine photo-lyase [Thermoanaerobaculia bacterium]|nr:deoxyribodipyrimidine photo-lyase [Thermoanaerobaculia bacterium]HXK66959.1 deoxyribodipyrimidine photo-lyase [Thermoanaerobaculia bacterium]
MILPERIRDLNNHRPQKKNYVLYWMQASQRVLDNHALHYAIGLANQWKCPLLVYFGLTDGYPGANLRHYRFMLEGLREVAAEVKEMGVAFVLRKEDPEEGVMELGREASAVVVDCGYTRIQKQWRSQAAIQLQCPLIQVETDVIVPVETAYPREAWSAAVLRRRVSQLLSDYLVPLHPQPLRYPWMGELPEGLDVNDLPSILELLDVDRTVPPVPGLQGGTARALDSFTSFVEHNLDHYHEDRNDPSLQGASGMSPYLHFGQISPLTLALMARNRPGPGSKAFLEELIVRRELAVNFVHYNAEYDTVQCLPEWAVRTLSEHASDDRETLYSFSELERSQTHDPYWNAAQLEMVRTGSMHGYMRMYWGKKILEWSATWEEAFQTALDLNNRWELDGRDPNGFAGVAWCFGKHDRPWQERAIFGKIRYMNDKGLTRKFDMDGYVQRISELEPYPF